MRTPARIRKDLSTAAPGSPVAVELEQELRARLKYDATRKAQLRAKRRVAQLDEVTEEVVAPVPQPVMEEVVPAAQCDEVLEEVVVHHAADRVHMCAVSSCTARPSSRTLAHERRMRWSLRLGSTAPVFRPHHSYRQPVAQSSIVAGGTVRSVTLPLPQNRDRCSIDIMSASTRRAPDACSGGSDVGDNLAATFGGRRK